MTRHVYQLKHTFGRRRGFTFTSFFSPPVGSPVGVTMLWTNRWLAFSGPNRKYQNKSTRKSRRSLVTRVCLSSPVAVWFFFFPPDGAMHTHTTTHTQEVTSNILVFHESNGGEKICTKESENDILYWSVFCFFLHSWNYFSEFQEDERFIRRPAQQPRLYARESLCQFSF